MRLVIVIRVVIAFPGTANHQPMVVTEIAQTRLVLIYKQTPTQLWTFRPLTGGVLRPGRGRQCIGQHQGIGLLQAFVRQQAQRMIGSGRQHVWLLARFEHAADAGGCPVERIRSTNAQAAPASSAAAIISAAIVGLV
jgi:hypothetical protein